MRVDVLVTDANGPVRGLAPADFEIRDNGVLQQIDLVSFEQIPLNVVLVLDMSDSVAGDRLDRLRAAGEGQVSATVVEHRGRLCGYASSISATGHAVGESSEAVQALIGAVSALERGGFLVPLRNETLLHWCLSAGLRVAVPQTLMSRGFYQEPAGAFLPSVLY